MKRLFKGIHEALQANIRIWSNRHVLKASSMGRFRRMNQQYLFYSFNNQILGWYGSFQNWMLECKCNPQNRHNLRLGSERHMQEVVRRVLKSRISGKFKIFRYCQQRDNVHSGLYAM